jgi:hypothetical protein
MLRENGAVFQSPGHPLVLGREGWGGDRVQLGVQAGKLASIRSDAVERALHALGHVWAIHTVEDNPAPPGHIDDFNRFWGARTCLPGDAGISPFLISQDGGKIRPGQLEDTSITPGEYLRGAAGGDGGSKVGER